MMFEAVLGYMDVLIGAKCYCLFLVLEGITKLFWGSQSKLPISF